MAPKKKSAARSSPISIGNCEVVVEANAFTTKSDQAGLQISVPRNAKIDITVKEETNSKICTNTPGLRPEYDAGAEDDSIGRDCFSLLVINPKHADCQSKSLLQEALNIYLNELPNMNYAADTGKESMFLEKCVFNGKYCTLVLKFKSKEGSIEVIAAVTYQIIPADTQYAEIPLAAVTSAYQSKGLGSFLYTELRRRLQSVGICTIFCWGDGVSEGFWLKQGFISVAEVGTKGRARRLPIKADICRALSFPGGSTLMVSHLQKDISYANTIEPSFPFHAYVKPSFTVSKQGQRDVREGYCTLTALDKMIAGTEKSQPEVSMKDNSNMNGSFPRKKALEGFRDLLPCEAIDCGSPASALYLNKTAVAGDAKPCCCSDGGGLKRIWESSCSSLKSKKVKGGHHFDCQSDSNRDFVLENEKINDSCLKGCSLSDYGKKFLAEGTPVAPLSSIFMERNAKNFGPFNVTSKDLFSTEIVSRKECHKVMLMNIADDTKKAALSKIIEDLGGITTSDGGESTHVITGKVRRTLNFCTALCSGAWIISPSWLKKSFQEGRFVDESPFILNDEDYKLRYRKELKDTVLQAKARPRALLKDYDVCLGAHVKPPRGTLSTIVSSAGGNVIRRLGNASEVQRIIFVASEEDMEEALLAGKRGIWTFSSDWFINCVMRQELDLEAPQFAESL